MAGNVYRYDPSVVVPTPGPAVFAPAVAAFVFAVTLPFVPQQVNANVQLPPIKQAALSTPADPVYNYTGRALQNRASYPYPTPQDSRIEWTVVRPRSPWFALFAPAGPVYRYNGRVLQNVASYPYPTVQDARREWAVTKPFAPWFAPFVPSAPFLFNGPVLQDMVCYPYSPPQEVGERPVLRAWSAAFTPAIGRNILVCTDTLNDTTWIEAGGTIATDGTAGPFGDANEAWLEQENSAGSAHELVAFASLATINSPYTLSIYAKLGSGTRQLKMQFNNALGGTASALFDLGAGTTSGATHCTSAIASIGSWYRCSIAFTDDGSGGSIFAFLLYNGTTTVYTGDGVSGIYFARPQLEVGGLTDYELHRCALPPYTTVGYRFTTVSQEHREWLPLEPWFAPFATVDFLNYAQPNQRAAYSRPPDQRNEWIDNLAPWFSTFAPPDPVYSFTGPQPQRAAYARPPDQRNEWLDNLAPWYSSFAAPDPVYFYTGPQPQRAAYVRPPEQRIEWLDNLAPWATPFIPIVAQVPYTTLPRFWRDDVQPRALTAYAQFTASDTIPYLTFARVDRPDQPVAWRLPNYVALASSDSIPPSLLARTDRRDDWLRQSPNYVPLASSDSISPTVLARFDRRDQSQQQPQTYAIQTPSVAAVPYTTLPPIAHRRESRIEWLWIMEPWFANFAPADPFYRYSGIPTQAWQNLRREAPNVTVTTYAVAPLAQPPAAPPLVPSWSMKAAYLRTIQQVTVTQNSVSLQIAPFTFQGSTQYGGTYVRSYALPSLPPVVAPWFESADKIPPTPILSHAYIRPYNQPVIPPTRVGAVQVSSALGAQPNNFALGAAYLRVPTLYRMPPAIVLALGTPTTVNPGGGQTYVVQGQTIYVVEADGSYAVPRGTIYSVEASAVYVVKPSTKYEVPRG